MVKRIYQILGNWSIGDICDIMPIDAGTSSKTFAVATSNAKYILRGLESREQAEKEYAVSNVLSGTNIGAEILPTLSGKCYVCCEDLFYNLQHLLAGNHPDFTEERQILSASKVIAKLHKTLTESSYHPSAYDRFSTEALLQKAKEEILPKGLFPEKLNTFQEREGFLLDLEMELSQSQVIHGDLGKWNMLWNGEKIRIIDFGECRNGDIHFDMAPLICEVFSTSVDRQCFFHRISLIGDAYNEIAGPLDRKKLSIAVYLWLLRGALASAVYIQNKDRGMLVCQSFADSITQLQSYFSDTELDI